MATLTAQDSTFEELAEGIHEATFSGFEEAEDRGFGPGFKLIWLIEENQNEKWQFCSQKLTPRSALWNVLKGLGHTPTLGQTYEAEDLFQPCIGVSANLVVKHEDGPNGPRAKIKDVLPIRKK